MIDYIANRQAVFVTNAIGHAKKLAEHGCKVYILGGEFKAVTEAIVGEEAVFTLDKYNFTKGFLGSQWCQPAEGIFHTGVKRGDGKTEIHGELQRLLHSGG